MPGKPDLEEPCVFIDWFFRNLLLKTNPFFAQPVEPIHYRISPSQYTDEKQFAICVGESWCSTSQTVHMYLIFQPIYHQSSETDTKSTSKINKSVIIYSHGSSVDFSELDNPRYQRDQIVLLNLHWFEKFLFGPNNLAGHERQKIVGIIFRVN